MWQSKQILNSSLITTFSSAVASLWNVSERQHKIKDATNAAITKSAKRYVFQPIFSPP
jgi:hypothetical protein